MDNRIGEVKWANKGGANQFSVLVRSLCGLLLCSDVELSRVDQRSHGVCCYLHLCQRCCAIMERLGGGGEKGRKRRRRSDEEGGWMRREWGGRKEGGGGREGGRRKEGGKEGRGGSRWESFLHPWLHKGRVQAVSTRQLSPLNSWK